MPNQRDHIIQAALSRYRMNGICGTTLKDVADAAGLPLGNLYYYFKTRDELVLAVLDACERELRGLLDRLAPLPPRRWLLAYFDWLLEDPGSATRLGCPFGTLAAELRALGDPAAPRAAQIVQVYFQAVREQTRALALPDAVADQLFLTVQGAYTVARVLGDPTLFRQSIEGLRQSTARDFGNAAP